MRPAATDIVWDLIKGYHHILILVFSLDIRTLVAQSVMRVAITQVRCSYCVLVFVLGLCAAPVSIIMSSSFCARAHGHGGCGLNPWVFAGLFLGAMVPDGFGELM